MKKLDNEDIALECIAQTQKRLGAIAGADPASVKVDNDIILRWVSRSFFTGKQQRVHFITHKDDLVQFSKADAADRLTTCFGSPIDLDPAGPNAKLFSGCKDDDDFERRRAKLTKTARATILEQIEIHRQRERLDFSVDMFAESARVETSDPMAAEVIFPYTPFKVVGKQNDLIARDYYEGHFPQARDVIEFVVASRFASNRKKSYLWLQAVSNFGKDLLFGTMEQVGAASSISMREVTQCLNGATGGRTADTLLNAFVCWFDEFRTVNPEIKMLQDSITISAKFMPLTRVPVYAKIFTSADDVKALAGDEGVEDQMANRFCHIKGKASIEDREMWSVPAYPNAVKYWTTTTLNELVESYRADAASRASARADVYLLEFYSKYGIEHNHERFSSNYKLKAYEFLLKMYELKEKMSETSETSEMSLGSQTLVFDNPSRMINKTQAIIKLANAADENILEETIEVRVGPKNKQATAYYLRRANHAWGLYVDAYVEQSAQVSMRNASADILKELDYEGARNRRVNGVQARAVRLPSYEEVKVYLGLEEAKEVSNINEESSANRKGHSWPWLDKESS